MNDAVNAHICYKLFDKEEKDFSIWEKFQDEFMFCLQILLIYLIYLKFSTI
jgi:hypothetical protein